MWLKEEKQTAEFPERIKNMQSNSAYHLYM